jgi:hypothetical protein
MTPRQAHAIGLLISAGEAMAIELALCADELEDDGHESGAATEWAMIRRWMPALATLQTTRTDPAQLRAGH